MAAELPLAIQADLLNLNRTHLYYKPVRPSLEEVALKHRIDDLFTAHPYYGSRRIAAHLRRERVRVNRKAVQGHMREIGITGTVAEPHASTRAPRRSVYPYLLGAVTSS
jgi:putative transposase